ncbi:hypothetical protein ABTM76_20010, partial [Acinetobacter baumannii]
ADCIERADPDVLALQEAVRWAEGPADAMPATAIDFLNLLLDALAERGLAYDLVARSPGPPLWLPFGPRAGGRQGLWLQDAVVIL